MESEMKCDNINGGTPMPQRVPKGQEASNNQGAQAGSKNNPQSDVNDGAPVEKKPRFVQASQGGLQNMVQKNFGGPKGGMQGNRNGNRGNNARSVFHNQNQQQQIEPKTENNNDNGKIDVNAFKRGGNRIVGGNAGKRDRRSLGGNRGGSGGSNLGGSGPGGNFGGSIGFAGGRGGGGDDYFIAQRMRALSGPTHELPPIEATEEPKFSGRNRLYVGNLTSDINEAELRELFKPFGEIGEIFLNQEKNFAFLKLDFHANAEKAKRELDGTPRKGRNLRVRFAPNATIIRIKNLTPYVSNELLYRSFEVFGPVERANVIVDDRGKHTGEGVVEFAKKNSALACLRLCAEKCFFLTASLRPCVVEPFDLNDDADGLPEKTLNKKSVEFNHERSVGPRFADIDSFEHEYGTRWKQLYELYKTKQEALKRELKMEEEKLEAQMEYARYEHETELLRQELRKRESDNERKKMEWEMREKQAEELRKRDEENLRRQQNEMQSRMLRQEEEMRRRQQENTLFMQAQQLNSLLDQQEGSQGGFGGGSNNFETYVGGGNNSPFDFQKSFQFAGNNLTGSANNQQDQFPYEFGGNNQNQGNQRGNNAAAAGAKTNNNNNPWERRRRF